MGRDMGPILDEIRQLKEERDSWRRVSERLEREKQDLISRLQITEGAIRTAYDALEEQYNNQNNGVIGNNKAFLALFNALEQIKSNP